jgi:hypothetical protein
MHVSSGVHITVEDVDKIRGYHDWLKTKIENPEAQENDNVPSGANDE